MMYTKPWLLRKLRIYRPRNKEILSNLDTIYSRTRNISKENISVETGPAFLSDFKEMTDFNTHEVNVIANGLEQSIGRPR
jgi:hypothetical protein